MTNDINKQNPTSQDGEKQQPTGQSQGQTLGQTQSQSEKSPEASSDQPETGGAQPSGSAGQDGETLTETTAETTAETTSEATTGEGETSEGSSGFVGSKKSEDESGYLQEDRKSESDIEGSSIKKDEQNS